jgi:hypothetical protein
MRTGILLAGLGMLLVTPLMAGEAAPSRSAPQANIDQWVQQLGDRDFHKRQKAESALTSLGSAALPALHKLQADADPELRRRADALIAHLERAVALTPKHITLHADKKPLKDVLSELGKQTGFKFADVQPAGFKARQLFTFHFDREPFWSALDKVCDATGLLLQQNVNYNNNGEQDVTLRLTSQDAYEPFRCYDGSFKVTATGFNYNRNTNFFSVSKNPGQPGSQASESLQLNLLIAVEPRLPIIKVNRPKATFAIDEQNASMLCERVYYPYEWDGYYNGNRLSYFQNTSVTLSWPSKQARTVRVVRGIIPVTLLAEKRPVVVTSDLLKAQGKKFTVGAATINIDSVSKTGSQYQIKISYTETTSDNQWDYSRIQAVPQRMELQDEKGNKITHYQRGTMYNSPTSAQFEFGTQAPAKNSKVGPPAKLVFQEWVQMEHEVPFEFKNLPLP